MLAALNSALDKAEAEAKPVILLGREKRFCAGFDLKAMAAGPDAVNALVTAGANLMTRLYGFKLPIIAACTGHALAAGGLLLLASDYRIGALGDFRIGLNEVAIGMTTPLFLLDFARDRIPTPLLHQATVQARLFSPDEAVYAGYLDEAVPAETMLETALSVAERLGDLPQPAYAASKLKLHKDTINKINADLPGDSSTFDGAS